MPVFVCSKARKCFLNIYTCKLLVLFRHQCKAESGSEKRYRWGLATGTLKNISFSHFSIHSALGQLYSIDTGSTNFVLYFYTLNDFIDVVDIIDIFFKQSFFFLVYVV